MSEKVSQTRRSPHQTKMAIAARMAAMKAIIMYSIMF